MIEIDYHISKEIKFTVNEMIGEIIAFFIHVCEGSDDFDEHMQYIFPSYLLREDFGKCKNVIYDLKDYTNDKYPHELEPLYEYALYYLIQWYIDITEFDDESMIDTSHLEIKSEDDKYFIENLNNLEVYKEFMFNDWDFLDVDEFVNIYLKSPSSLKAFNINLYEYKDLMPKDIRMKCFELKNENNILTDIKELVIRLIYRSVKLKEKDPKRLNKISETQLSNDIADILETALLEKGIITAREQPGGFALKGPGELDFFIYSNSEYVRREIAIGENKEWGNFEKQVKQLLGYMTENIEFGFTIIFNKSTKLETILERRKNILKGFSVEVGDGRFFETIEIKEGFKEMEDVLVTKHKNPENGSLFELYHFICNSHRPEREVAARQARLKVKVTDSKNC